MHFHHIVAHRVLGVVAVLRRIRHRCAVRLFAFVFTSFLLVEAARLLRNGFIRHRRRMRPAGEYQNRKNSNYMFHLVCFIFRI